MKHLFLIFILISSMFAQAEGVSILSDLDSLVWKNRIIVVRETENEGESLQLLKDYIAKIDERDIVWFIFKEDSALTNFPGQLSAEFVRKTRERLKPVQGKVILIGKDGGIKSESDSLDLEVIFSEIDAMPMRQFEMRN